MDGIDIFGFGAVAFILGYLLYIIYYTLDLFFLNPFKRIPPLTAQEERAIQNNLPFYNHLSRREKERFRKRVVRFRNRKKMLFHEDVIEKEKITLLLSATAVMLTLGMADFLILSVEKIMVYPKAYYSKFTKKDHYGEYNPNLKTLIFSEEYLLHGFKIPNDNINLAVHEFSHAISFNIANKLNIRSYIFMFGMRRIHKLFHDVTFIAKVDSTGYFRQYGKTNIHEFFAVSVENFVETPDEFKRQFPKLYGILLRMLNFGFYKMTP
ncbi:zinc-dependent peptidase [uncultured Maribacter sp.]|uniref:zinc-dependent peptidase n=1 Tax=uncultured Maribacter sp. TaxID=431308 RepID=UPI00262CD2E6|nr:zinc-dependent peptidase [uncultured Maribacter sp.]